MPSPDYRKEYFKRLGVGRKTSNAELKEAYRSKALRCHKRKASPKRNEEFVVLTVAFVFLESYGHLGKAAFMPYESVWLNDEKFQAEHKAGKMALLSTRDFIRSDFYRELLEDSEDVSSLVATIGAVVAFSLPFVLYAWQGTAGAVVGGVFAFIAGFPLIPYARKIRHFRFSRFKGHVELLFNEPVILWTSGLLINGLAIPFFLFRFVIPLYLLPGLYLAAVAGFLLISRILLTHKSTLYARQFVLLGAPTFVTGFFLLNIPSFHPVAEETYAFEPTMELVEDEWGREHLTTTTMIDLEGQAYEKEAGIRIFGDMEGFNNDSITYRISTSVVGIRFVRSWEFH